MKKWGLTLQTFLIRPCVINEHFCHAMSCERFPVPMAAQAKVSHVTEVMFGENTSSADHLGFTQLQRAPVVLKEKLRMFSFPH